MLSLHLLGIPLGIKGSDDVPEGDPGFKGSNETKLQAKRWWPAALRIYSGAKKGSRTS